MTEPDFERVREIVGRALELEAPEREEFVRSQCAGDSALLAEVSRLLKSAGSADDTFLVPPAAAQRIAQPSERRLGEFTLVRELGRGGMGSVHLARQPALDRHVAIKVLYSGFTTTPEQIERFHREARAVAKLQHPNIVQVLTDGTTDDIHWFAMEYVPGRDLSAELAIQRGASDRGEPYLPRPGQPSHAAAAAEFCAQVAEGLQHAHDRGVVHRDVKPHNLLVHPDRLAKVVDFGLARDAALGRITHSGALAGTPHYMSPEQARATRGVVDHRTDVYSLGVVLYEMLTLARPFTGKSSREIVSRILTHEPRAVRRRNGSVPRDLATICAKAMAKNVRSRYASAGDFARDLRRFLAFEAIEARPTPRLLRVLRFALRHRVASAVAATALVSVVAAWLIGGALARERTWRERFEPLAGLVDLSVDELADLPPAKLVAARQSLQQWFAEPPPDRREPVERLRLRLAELQEKWYADATGMVRSALDANGRGAISDATVLDAYRLLLKAAVVFPDDGRIRSLAADNAFAPRVSIRATDASGRALDGTAYYRVFDRLLGTPGERQDLGPLPVAAAALAPGLYRFIIRLDNGEFRELTRILDRGRGMELDVAVRALPLATADMRRVGGGVLRLDPLRPFEQSPLVGRETPIAPFLLDRHEVTNREYREFLEATGRPAPRFWRFVTADHDDLPVIGVLWDEARAYAEWAGKRLPTHAEWLWEASGPSQRRYPWTDTRDAVDYLGNTRAVRPAVRPRGAQALFAQYVADCSPVDAAAGDLSRNGVRHMLGNVAEWVDGFSVEPDRDTFITLRDGFRLAAGSAWFAAQFEHDVRTVWRSGPGRADVKHYIGFRCARSVDP